MVNMAPMIGNLLTVLSLRVDYLLYRRSIRIVPGRNSLNNGVNVSELFILNRERLMEHEKTVLGKSFWIRLAVLLVVLAIFLAAIFFDSLIRPHWLRTLAVCFSWGVIYFGVGFQPQSESYGARKSLLISGAIGSIAVAINGASVLSSIHDFPSSQREGMMLKPPFLIPFLSIIGSGILGYVLGVSAFRWRHPAEWIVPLTPEEKQLEEEETPRLRSEIRRTIAFSLMAMMPSFIAIFAFPRYSIRVMVINVLLVMCVMSFIVGRRWIQLDRSIKWLSIFLLIICPLTSFYGSYSGSKSHDIGHAMMFSSLIAGSCIFPAIFGRIVGWRDANI